MRWRKNFVPVKLGGVSNLLDTNVVHAISKKNIQRCTHSRPFARAEPRLSCDNVCYKINKSSRRELVIWSNVQCFSVAGSWERPVGGPGKEQTKARVFFFFFYFLLQAFMTNKATPSDINHFNMRWPVADHDNINFTRIYKHIKCQEHNSSAFKSIWVIISHHRVVKMGQKHLGDESATLTENSPRPINFGHPISHYN